MKNWVPVWYVTQKKPCEVVYRPFFFAVTSYDVFQQGAMLCVKAFLGNEACQFLAPLSSAGQWCSDCA